MSEKIKLTKFRDDMMHQILAKVSFSRFDFEFMDNMRIKYVATSTPMSEKQNALYEKLIQKYRKQLKKLGISYQKILATPWKNGVLAKSALRKKTFFRVQEDCMDLYFNFDKKLISNIRELLHDDAGHHINKGLAEHSFTGHQYNFEWNKKNKIWAGPFNVYLFKELCKFAQVNDIPFDSSVVDLTDQMMMKYGTAQNWQPHIHIVEGRMYVSQIVETMLPFLEKIDMTDISIRNIERITKLGVNAPEQFGEISEYMNSNTSTQHVISSLDDLELLGNYIQRSGGKPIIYNPHTRFSGALTPQEEKFADWATGVGVLVVDQDRVNDEMLRSWSDKGYDTLISTQSFNSLLYSQNKVGEFGLLASKVIVLNMSLTE